MVDEVASGSRPPAVGPDGDRVAQAAGSEAGSIVRGATEGAPPDEMATSAAASVATVAHAAGAEDIVDATRAVTASTVVGQAIVQGARSGSPSALGAMKTTAGAAGALVDAVGSVPTARIAAKAASIAQQTLGTTQALADVATSARSSSSDHSGSLYQRGEARRVTSGAHGMAVAGERALDAVHFELGLPHGPEIQWHIQKFTITSELSRLYEIRLDLVCHDVEAPVDEMLGAPCELLIERGDLLHSFYGIIDEIDDVGSEQQRLHACVHVIPAFGLLADQIDTRIFQGQTAIEILTEVLQAALAPYGREVDTSTCITREYHARDYCTQFRESTLEFCCRLMEEEGITFHLIPDVDGRREKLVLVDNNNDLPEVEFGGYDEIPIIDNNPEEADRESLRGVLWRQRRGINKVAGRAYNFKAAESFDEATVSVQEDQNHHEQALYLHDRRRQITDDPVGDPTATSFDGTGLAQREQLVTQVLQEHRAQTKIVEGHGNVTGFRPGARFTLGSHHHGDLDGAELLLVRVNHFGEANTENAGATTSYGNDFTAIPVTHEFRPLQRHRKAKVYGPQLARVVGKPDSEDEIHTDPYGRIKVQFHFDRLQPADNTASAWIRVVQPWAGPQWGTMFIPRVGMEVVVQFVDGNPDNPVVTGSVYNSRNKPPFVLPDEKTKSTIKTSSSVGGGGYNELTFEDAAGQEQIIVHAQKDFNKTVVNDQTRSVGANDSTSVGGDQSLSVTGDRTHSITGNETITVNGSQKISIVGASTGDGQTVTGGQIDITGQYKLDATKNIEVQAPDYILLTVGSTFMKIEPDRITLQQKDGARVVLSPDSALVASKENSQLALTADAQLQASTGGDLMLTANAQLTGQSAQVLLDGNALVRSASAAEVKLDADAKMSGANATVDATTSSTVSAGSTSTLTAGGSTVKAAGGAVDVSGPQANIAGAGAVNITGGIIKLN